MKLVRSRKVGRGTLYPSRMDELDDIGVEQAAEEHVEEEKTEAGERRGRPLRARRHHYILD